MKNIIFVGLTIISLAFSSAHSQVQASNTPLATGGPDQFGYTWDDGVSNSGWKDLTIPGSTQVFPNPDTPNTAVDDLTVGPFSVGFNVPYYENTFTQIYINSNGLIGFDTSLGEVNYTVVNTIIPTITSPQNFLAPFWDDLVIGGTHNNGKVYFGTGTDASGKYFAVEWFQVSRLGYSGLLTFEVVMYENGNVYFRYQAVNGGPDSFTIGIEDSLGADGLNYLYNQSGFTAPKSILFSRPPPGARSRIAPDFQSAFAVNRTVSFSVQITNTGDGSDRFNLSASATGDWTPSLFTIDGVTPLPDTNGDLTPDTGLLAKGASISVVLKAQSSLVSQAGSYSDVVLTSSSTAGSHHATANMRAAIPAPFVQVVAGGSIGINVQRIDSLGIGTTQVNGSYGIKPFGVALVGTDQFLASWEKDKIREVTPGNFVSYSEIEYVLMDHDGGITRAIDDLVDHGDTTGEIYDQEAVITATPDGKIGVAWVNLVVNAANNCTIYNTHFLILASDGAPLYGPLNVTANNLCIKDGDNNYLDFRFPRIAADAANHFHLSWLQRSGSTKETDIAYAIYSSSGQTITSPFLVTSGHDPILNYDAPSLDSLMDGNIAFAYPVSNTSTGVNQISVTRRDSTGGVVSNGSITLASSAIILDSSGLSNGQLALSWQDQEKRANYAVLNTSLAPVTGPAEFAMPDGRDASNISVTHDDQGRAIYTWQDASQEQRMYYALVNAQGLVTPPMYFYGLSGATLAASSLTQGNAAYFADSNQGLNKLYMPFLSKK